MSTERRLPALLHGTLRHSPVTVRLDRIEAGSEHHLRTEVAVHEVADPVHGSSLGAVLLDERYRPLNRRSSAWDHVGLPSVCSGERWTSMRTDLFEAAAIPRYVKVLWCCDSLLLALPEGDGDERRADDDDRRADGDGRDDDEEAAEGPGPQDPEDPDDGPEAPPDDGEPGPRCVLKKLEVPTGNQKTIALTRTGTVPGFDLLQEPFKVVAEFSGEGAEANCKCCEFRLDVKGTAFAGDPTGAPGHRTNLLSFPTDFEKGEGLRGRPTPVLGIKPDVFTECTYGDMHRPGRPHAYGHRGDTGKRAPTGVWTPKQHYENCRYWGLLPGGVGASPQLYVPTGGKISIDLVFRGRIIDTCRTGEDGEPLQVEAKEWTWKYERDFR